MTNYIDIDKLILFVESKRVDHEFIKNALIRAGIYDKDLKLNNRYKRKANDRQELIVLWNKIEKIYSPSKNTLKIYKRNKKWSF